MLVSVIFLLLWILLTLILSNMKQVFIDVRTSRNGEIVDSLCVNKATGQQLNAVLTLADVGDEILIIKRELEVTAPEIPFADNN